MATRAHTHTNVTRLPASRANGRKTTNGAKTNDKKTNGAARAERSAYDAFKEFEGQRYTGMKIGRGHKWHYDSGDWTEKKVTPDKWEFRYTVKKRRAGQAPEGSGVPVGTAYHWYILGHQTVTKLDANTYDTDMAGLKYKLAHKRADKNTWSASDAAQRRNLIKILQEMIASLQKEGGATPIAATKRKQPGAKPMNAQRNGSLRIVAASVS